jgi:hypothetical protein
VTKAISIILYIAAFVFTVLGFITMNEHYRTATALFLEGSVLRVQLGYLYGIAYILAGLLCGVVASAISICNTILDTRADLTLIRLEASYEARQHKGAFTSNR